MADITLDFEARTRQAEAGLQRIRDRITNLNAEMAHNNRLALTSSEQEQERLRDSNKVLAVEKQLLNVRTQRQRELIRDLKDEAAARMEATREGENYAEIIKEIETAIREAGSVTAELQDTQRGLNVFWRAASGELGNLNSEFDTLIPSTIDLTEAQKDLNAAVQAGIDTSGVGDPLRDYIDGLHLTSEAADRAFGEINQVGEAIRDADFTRAAAELTDFDDAFQLSEATIPRVTSAMMAFTGTAPDVEKVERAVEMTTRSVEDLLDEIEGLGDGNNVTYLFRDFFS